MLCQQTYANAVNGYADHRSAFPRATRGCDPVRFPADECAGLDNSDTHSNTLVKDTSRLRERICLTKSALRIIFADD